MEGREEGIITFIPFGHKNAITRAELAIRTGLSDRVIRNMIAKTRRIYPILNLQDGKGYYRPDMEDPVDKAELAKYKAQEEHRLKSIGWSLKAAREALRNDQTERSA